MKILLVDESWDRQNRMLSQIWDYNVSVAESPDTAFSLMRANKFDIVSLGDFSKDDFEFLTGAIYQTQDAPWIVLHGDDEDNINSVLEQTDRFTAVKEIFGRETYWLIFDYVNSIVSEDYAQALEIVRAKRRFRF